MSWVMTGSQKVNWDPSLISTALWLDAADASTVTASSSLITEWRDKSGNGKHVTAADALRPTYTSAGLNAKSVVTYSGSQSLQAATASDWKFLHDGTKHSVFAVWKAGTSSDPNATYSLCSTRTSGANTVGALIRFDDRTTIPLNNAFAHTAVNLFGESSQTYVNNISANDSHSPNVATMVGVDADPSNSTAVDRSIIRINAGAQIKNNTGDTSAPSTNNPQHAIIIGASQTNYLAGYIAEFVIVSGVVTTLNRQRIEGYLAHKWGLTANLPNDHPYKVNPPAP